MRGAGGSPDCIINKAKRLCGSRAYDECFVLIDNDRKIHKHNKKIKILTSTLCIEGLFLGILNHPKFSQNNVSSDCKKEFERNYLSDDKKMDKRGYDGIFPREMLDEQRKHIPEFEGILKAMRL